jgi:hypothetical protein
MKLKNRKTKKILLLKKHFNNNNFVELIDNIVFMEFINEIKLKDLKNFCRFMKHKDLRIAIMMRNNLHREGKNF